LGHSRKFPRVSRLGFVTAPMSLNEGQPNFARCLAASWAATLYIHFQGLLPPNGICQVENSLCVQVSRSPILADLLHGTRAVGISQTAAVSRRRHLYSPGRPSRWASVVGIYIYARSHISKKLECGPMPNLTVALPNIGGALCSTPQSLADAHY